MIKVENLKRYYQGKTVTKAVDDISFTVEKGEIFGLIGPNGAGKSTTIKVLTTLLLPTEGNVKIFDLDINKRRKEIQRRINFIYGGERSLYWRLTAKENLIYFADLYSVNKKIIDNRIDELLEMVGLTEFKNRKVETFSKGMKQRLQIARGLINDPEIIFMDEPTIGLDPTATKILHDIILIQKKLGKTIILTTHYMKEAEDLCDRIAFISNGEIISIESPKQHIELVKNKSKSKIDNLESVYLHYFGKLKGVKP